MKTPGGMNKKTGGWMPFVDRHGLWTAAHEEAAERVAEEVRDRGIEVIRLSFADQHGILRGKSVAASALPAVMRDGCSVVSTLLAKDTAHRTVYPVFTADGGFGLEEMGGGGDIVMVPDPSTFRVLPWLDTTGWLLCDLYFPNGRAVPFSTRQIARDALTAAEKAGYDYVSGVEVEFHAFRLKDALLTPEHSGQPAAPPEVEMVAHGFQHLTEQRLDQHEPLLSLLHRDLTALALPIQSLEVEYGPSQCEVTMRHEAGLAPADMMILFRSAAKQIARRHGYHVSFMCRPGLDGFFSSGGHLHQSLVSRETGENAFMPASDDAILSEVGRHFTGGLLAHAAAASVFTTPTVNGYKRFQPYSLAPDRANWARDNRGVMIRALNRGAGDPATRVENRIGEPAANPYLYMASQIYAGLDGLEKATDPGPPAETPYESDATPLPRDLGEAMAALNASALYRQRLGDRFVDYILHLKEAELVRYRAAVTAWEHREYFDIF